MIPVVGLESATEAKAIEAVDLDRIYIESVNTAKVPTIVAFETEPFYPVVRTGAIKEA